MYNTSRVIRNC